MNDLRVTPATGPLQATVRLPGSKSITNRALICAALATGTSVLDNVLDADDTAAMIDAVRQLGANANLAGARVTIEGLAGRPRLEGQRIDARQSGTTARFVLPVASLGTGSITFDGHEQLRGRPMGPGIVALRELGVEIVGDALPLQITSAGWRSQTVRLRGDTSSQFLSGLLLAAPVAPDGLRIELTSELVSEPYVDMTIAVMRRFGAVVHRPEHAVFVVESGGYRATPYVVEPDASAASYPWAAAALCGGSVTVADLGTDSVQGDVRFVDVLEAMGAVVDRHPDRITVHGAALHGVETDLADISDTAPTFAVVAALAEGPSRATGIGFIRAKESDRVGAVVAELVRCGVGAVVEADGFAITPSRGRIGPAIVETYGDHRMAMAFALLGLAGGDVTIHDPGCVAKTFPGYWMLLDELRASAVPGQ